MVNEDDILLVSGGFTMDASQSSPAEQTSQNVDNREQSDDCSQLDSAMGSHMRSGATLQQYVVCTRCRDYW